MVTLIWAAREQRFIRAGYPEIRAVFATVEDAQRQAAHDLTLGKQPLRIEDEHGHIVWTPERGE
jgi:hypothetical protein